MTIKRTSLLRGLVAALALRMLATSVFGGDIAGSVVTATGSSPLPGASITVLESGRREMADSAGRFRINALAAGTYTVRVEYLGYEAKTESVDVPASGAVPLVMEMGGDEVVQLETMVVSEGYRAGRTLAFQQKQNTTNIVDIISADAIGNLPDRNIAEAVARVPGVSITGMEQGEGRYVSIRGIDPNLNQVMMDGAVLAAPGGVRLGRAVPLDTLGAGDISRIEVIKSVTPDLDANSLGGTINIKSGSPFDRKGRLLSGGVSGNRNEAAGKNNLEGRFNYSDLFGADNKWGIAVSGSYEKRDYENHWVQTSWNDRSSLYGPGVYIPNGFEIKPEEGRLKRYGGNFSLEFRPNDSLKFYLRPSFSATRRFEHTVEIIDSTENSIRNNVLDVVFDTPTSGTFRGRNRTERRDFRTFKDQDLFSLVGGFSKVIGDLTIEPMVTYSKAKETTPFNRILAFRNGNGQTGPIQFDFTSFDFDSWVHDYTVDTPNRYTLRRTRDDTGLVDEKTLTAKLDLRLYTDNFLGTRQPGFFKTGVKYLQRERVADLESYRLTPVGNWNLTNIGVLPSVKVYDDKYDSGFLLDHDATWDYIDANPALVQYDPVGSIENSIEDDYDIDEWIYAAYLMGSVDINKLTLLGGVRWERTDATIRAVDVLTVSGSLVGRTPVSGTTTYDKFFPNLQAVYRFNDHLLLRGALTKTIGRPAYEDARPLNRVVRDPIIAPSDPAYPNTGSVNVGNPALGPYKSQNIDVSLEYYHGESGVISIAGFIKNIDDPIYTFVEELDNVVLEGYGFQHVTLTSRKNADSGKIRGVELNVYQPFTFLPSPWDGFGIDANVTFISSSLQVERPTLTSVKSDLPFFRQPSRIYNFTLFYERNRFSGRVAYSYSDEALESLGSDALSDRYRVPRGQVDVLARYRISEHYSITAAVRNLTRQPEQRSFGVFDLMQYSRLLGREFKLGVDFNF